MNDETSLKSRIKKLLRTRRETWKQDRLTMQEIVQSLGVEYEVAYPALCELGEAGEVEAVALPHCTLARHPTCLCTLANRATCLAWKLKP